MNQQESLKQSCQDILHKNMGYNNQKLYLLYDVDSPLAKMLSEAYISILPDSATTRIFKNPPQPLYR